MQKRIVECENEFCTECFTLDETIINEDNHLFCPHCGKGYEYNPIDGTISLASYPTTYTYCRKCGIEILKVHSWQDAVCDGRQCIEQSEFEIHNLGRDEQ